MLRKIDSVGLFPGLSGIGGIESAGRIAWDCVKHLAGGDAFMISYGPEETPLTADGVFVCNSRARACRRAATLALRSHRALAWHTSLVPLLAVLRPVPKGCAVYLHGVESWRALSRVERAAFTITRPLIMTNSEETRRRFLAENRWAAGLASTVVPLGLGSRVCGPPHAPVDPPAAVMVGRMHRGEAYKGHSEVISAWPEVLRHLPDAELWIVGDGNLRPELETHAAALGLATHVRFFGQLSDEGRDDRLSSARCLALPSKGEGFGLVYLEAMRLGRPCLVSDVDAGREVVEPPVAGVAVDPGDGEAIAQALVRLLTPGDEWTTWSVAAERRYSELYTEAAFRRRFAEAWQRVEA